MVLPVSSYVIYPQPCSDNQGLNLSELASVMDSAPMPVFALDYDGLFVYENKVAEDFVGYDRSEVTGQHLRDLLIDDADSLMEDFERLKRTGHLSHSIRYQHRNGAPQDANVNNFRLTFADGTNVFVSLVHRLYGASSGVPKVQTLASDFGLTGGEMRLMYLLADDFPHASIARLLGEPADAVALQIEVLLSKMKLASRTEGAVLAIKKRLVL